MSTFRTPDLRGFEQIIRYHEPLAMHTWFQLGGPAEYFAEPRTEDELKQLIIRANSENLPMHILGSGSNLLVREEGVPGLVIRLSEEVFQHAVISGSSITVSGGTALGRLITTAVRAGLAGIEELVGIPGTVGGALHGNAGTNSTNLGQWLKKATVITMEGSILERDKEEVIFGYRHSSLDELIILNATFTFHEEDSHELAQRMQKQWIIRKAAQPQGHKSTGCIFKDPDGISAKDLIEAAGLRGTRIGGASVSERHANFIVTDPECTVKDILRLIDLIISQVLERSGVELEPGLEIW